MAEIGSSKFRPLQPKQWHFEILSSTDNRRGIDEIDFPFRPNDSVLSFFPRPLVVHDDPIFPMDHTEDVQNVVLSRSGELSKPVKVDIERESPDRRVASDEFRRDVKGRMGFEERGVTF